MRTIHKIIIIILSLLVLNVHAQKELDGYLKLGAENNPGLKAKFAEYNAALEKVPQVGTLPDPTISFGYFITPVETRVGQHTPTRSLNVTTFDDIFCWELCQGKVWL